MNKIYPNRITVSDLKISEYNYLGLYGILTTFLDRIEIFVKPPPTPSISFADGDSGFIVDPDGQLTIITSENKMNEEKFTPEQIAKKPLYRKKWLEIGLKTKDGPFDMEKAIEAAKLHYELNNQGEVNEFYLFRSPYEAKYGASIIKLLKDNPTSTQRKKLKEALESIYESGIKAIKALDLDDLGLTDALLSNTYDEMVYGCHEAHWLEWYDFAIHELGSQDARRALGLIEIAKNVGWWTPYDGCAIFQEKPTKISLDENERLHNENGPCLEWDDGHKMYGWHGTEIPGEWVENKDNINPVDILREKNVELRRCGVELIGWHRLFEVLEHTLIDSDPDPEIGELYEMELPDSGKEKFLMVQCGTGRKFALPVPPDMKTAFQANAWTYHYDNPEDFIKPEVRT